MPSRITAAPSDEPNESNNYKQLDLTVLPERQSDLVVTNLALVTSPVYKGQDFSVSVTVQNQGAMTITQVSALGIYVDHQPTGPGDAAWKNTTMVPTLGPGASHTATVVIPAAAVTSVGNHQVFAYADIGNTVVEKNATLTGEDNNAFGPVAFTAEWPPLPDLYLVGVTVQGATEDLPAREAITYTVYVQNDGPVASSAASLALFADPDGPPVACNATGAFAFGTIPAIPAGEAAAVVVRTAGFTTPGTYNVWAFADYTCNLDEYQDRESNNQYALNVVVGPPRLADLRVRDLAPKDGVEVIAGKYFTLTVDIINEGDLKSGATRLGVYTGTLPSDPDPVQAWQADVAALRPNESTLIDMPNRRIDIPGSQHVWAFADFFAWEEESDETDNVYTGTLTVLAPNLKVTALTLQPATNLHAQEYFTATVTVLSNGDVPSEATWLDHLPGWRSERRQAGAGAGLRPDVRARVPRPPVRHRAARTRSPPLPTRTTISSRPTRPTTSQRSRWTCCRRGSRISRSPASPLTT